MGSEVRDRDRDGEIEDRDRYVILLHLYTISQTGPVGHLGIERIASDLGLLEVRCIALLRSLESGGYIAHTFGDRVTVTTRGCEYIEKLAGRRRSLRMRPERPGHGRAESGAGR
jgi:hypothetical protein